MITILLELSKIFSKYGRKIDFSKTSKQMDLEKRLGRPGN